MRAPPRRLGDAPPGAAQRPGDADAGGQLGRAAVELGAPGARDPPDRAAARLGRGMVAVGGELGHDGLAGKAGPERLFGHHQVLRHQHDGGGAAVRGGLERHPDPVPLGQLADHEQAQLLAVGRVEFGRVGQPVVELGQPRRVQPQAAVLDLDREPVGDRVP